MAAWPAALRDRQPGGHEPASGAERRSVIVAAAPPRFNPAASRRIAGSVAAQRVREHELAASGADGTRSGCCQPASCPRLPRGIGVSTSELRAMGR